MMTPAQALCKTKAELNLSDVQVAAVTGMSPSAIARLSAGENNPRWDTVVKIAKKLPRFGELIGLVEAA